MAEFCSLCDVSLDLHDGPNTCHTAAQKEFIIALPFALDEMRR
ncbi:MAG TPA: hypothetical protein VJL80_09910 [Aeromicrobium sp.]|nr:hypothetical protein [Aeromicrobium sp.]HKY58341.1 hypothetical protein [Aeromicrobium sp.]